MTDESQSRLQHYLERLRQGDPTARNELLEHTSERLRRLAHDMLKGYPRLKRWEETDDVLQSALMRLYRSLTQVTPPTLRDYYRLAALQIRRELLDLVRHHYGPQGEAAHHQTSDGRRSESDSAVPAAYERQDVSLEPSRLAQWSEFHRQADRLPEEEMEVFDLIWYQGLSPVEAAELLSVSAKTVKRRFQAASLRLHEALGGELPR